MSVADDSKNSILQYEEQISSGWKLSDLKSISGKANTKRSESSASRVRALAKVSVIAKKLNQGQETLSEKLFKINPSVTICKQTDKYVQLNMASNLKLPVLPKYYGFKGGAARIALLNTLAVNTTKILPRDIDLVRIGNSSIAEDNEIAARFMPEDFKHGHGVEIQPTLIDYFESRDLTINEVFLSGKKLSFSLDALNDLKLGNVRLSKQYKSGNLAVPARLICKMIRLKAELELLGLNGQLELPEFLPKITEYDIAFHLKRAAQTGYKVSARYVELLKLYLNIDYKANLLLNESTQADLPVSGSRSAALRFQMHQRKRR